MRSLAIRKRDGIRVVDVLKDQLTPIIYHTGGWEDTVPEWMLSEVVKQRAQKITDGDDGLATNVEAAIYLYTASLAFPFDSDWTDIYIYLVTQLMPDMPGDIRRDNLTKYQEGLLYDLKRRMREKQKKRKRKEHKC